MAQGTTADDYFRQISEKDCVGERKEPKRWVAWLRHALGVWRFASNVLRDATETERPAAPSHNPADVRAALDGDDQRMGELIRVLRPGVQAEVAWTLERYAPRGQRRDARQEVLDMVQEVFVALLENDGKILRAWNPTRGRSLKSFTKLVARHQVVSILRSQRRSPWKEDPTPVEELNLTESQSPERRVAQADQAHQLLGALRGELSTRSMMMFEALYVEERTVEEICEEFGVSRDAVYAWRSRLKRRIANLKAKLGLEVNDA